MSLTTFLKEKKNYTSSNLGEEVEIKLYGHFGYILLFFPTISDNPDEPETLQIIESLQPFLEKGKFRVVTVPGITYKSWFDESKTYEERSKKHYDYNNFLLEEVVPSIFSFCGGPVPIMTCGAANGAFQAANTYFRRPDLFHGTIALSGTFNIEHYSKNYFDSNCYFNSPIHYLPNLNDSYWLSFLQSKNHVYIMSGSGQGEFPENSRHLSDILNSKNIPNFLDIWGPEWDHNVETWKVMLNFLFSTKL
ncbi:MAG: esterase [Candidatus Kapabacteria bacterium]|nr:esterase [Candidatus Kapabacteria bacterium]